MRAVTACDRLKLFAAPFEPAHQSAHHGQRFVQLLGGVPVVAVQRDQALLVEHQVRCAAHRLRHALVKVLEGEQEIPGQKALLALPTRPVTMKRGCSSASNIWEKMPGWRAPCTSLNGC